MPVTARDVARVAGVSVSTVSRALTKPDKVEPGTRTLVLETARGMGYRPDRAACGRITGRSVGQAMVHPRALGHRRIAHLGGPSASWLSMQRLDVRRVFPGQNADTKVVDLGSFQSHVSGGVAACPTIPAMWLSSVSSGNRKSEGSLLSTDPESLGNGKDHCTSARIRHRTAESCFAVGNLIGCLRFCWYAK